MRNTTERRVLVYSLERLDNSANGNPRYRVHTDGGPYTTSADAGFCYGIENNRIRGVETQEATLTLTRAGMVADLKWHPVTGNKWPGDCDHDRDLCADCITRCRPCEVTYDSPQALALHVRNEHASGGPNGCAHCGRPGGH